MKTILLFCALVTACAAQDRPALRNMSALVSAGPNPVTVGFVVAAPSGAASTSIRLLVRAVTWNLDTFGLNPAERVIATLTGPAGRAPAIVASLPGNDGLISAAEVSVGAFARRPATALVDAAYIVEMPAGSLTVSVVAAGRSGDAIIEVYQLPDPPAPPPPPPAPLLPPAPTGLVVVSGTARAIWLEWDASPDQRVNEYSIYRATTKNSANPAKIAETQGITFVDTSISPDVRYYYWITAHTFPGELVSPKSNPASGVTGKGI